MLLYSPLRKAKSSSSIVASVQISALNITKLGGDGSGNFGDQILVAMVEDSGEFT